MGFVYQLTNRHNGKKYVGQTTCDVVDRWKGHCYSSKKCATPIYNAIRKYGEEAFAVEVLRECRSDMLNLYEAAYIKRLGTRVPKGYNLRAGGGQQLSGHHELTKMKLRGVKSSEHRKKIADRNRERAKDPIWRQKISKTLREKCRTTSRSVVQLTQAGAFVKSWGSAADAARAVGQQFSSNVHKACRGEVKVLCGYRWMYADEFHTSMNLLTQGSY